MKTSLSQQVRDVLRARDRTLTELALLTGVDATVLGRFLASERAITTTTLDKIACALNLRVVEDVRASPRKRGKS